MFYKLKKTFLNKNFIIFGIIGLLNTLVYNSIYLLSLMKLPYLLSSIIAYIVSMTFSFIMNCYFNFKVKPTLKKYIMFPISGIPTLICQTIGLTFFVEVLGTPQKWSGFICSLVAIPISFIIMKKIIKK
ncbi:MAG: GtrA family protein [Bacilli bacterium]